MTSLKVLDLFSGIGGFTLGLERAGHQTIAFCEIEPFCQKVLKKHWSHIPIFSDITLLHGTDLPSKPDLICGGFPCQDLSVAGKQAGLSGTRSSLWWEMHRLIGECRPDWVLVENVPNLRTKGADEVLTSLEREGYSCWPSVVGAWAVGAEHPRERVWILAHTQGKRMERMRAERFEKSYALDRTLLSVRNSDGKWEVEPDVCREVHGVSDRIHRLKALGNSVVPQIPQLFGEFIARHS